MNELYTILIIFPINKKNQSYSINSGINYISTKKFIAAGSLVLLLSCEGTITCSPNIIAVGNLILLFSCKGVLALSSTDKLSTINK